MCSPPNFDGNRGNGVEAVNPVNAALSRDSSPELVTICVCRYLSVFLDDKLYSDHPAL